MSSENNDIRLLCLPWDIDETKEAIEMFIGRYRIKWFHMGLGLFLSAIMIGFQIWKRTRKEETWNFTQDEDGGNDDDTGTW